MLTANTSQRSKRRQRADETAHVRSGRPRNGRVLLIVGGIAIVLAVGSALSYPWWLPRLQSALGVAGQTHEGHEAGEDHVAEPADTHAGHSHAGHDEATSLSLSEQGRKNIGLTLATVGLRDFERTIAVPATLVERPGQSVVAVSAPLTGIVTRIYPIRGEAVVPGAPLFDLRLTHEDLVEKQSSLLRLLEEQDVVQKEVERLEGVTASGAVAGKRLLEQQYELHKIEAAIRAERQALLLHGLSEKQIEQIVVDRQLQQSLTLTAPELAEHVGPGQHEDLLQVAELAASVGEHVQTGVRLATLTDHCELYIEGKAFEQDADALNRVANAGTEVAALIEGNGSGDHVVSGLKILHVENQVERESRALNFYVPIANELVRNEQTADGHRFIGWRYKPGQRVELRVPVEQWKRKIVLPVEAVIEEGPERYVYQEIQGHFDRRPVHVEYRDRRFAVIESDGTLFPGDKVAAEGAQQIHLALKNKAGGGPDPHAGHHH